MIQIERYRGGNDGLQYSIGLAMKYRIKNDTEKLKKLDLME